MNNDELKLDALTDQKVTFSLGGKNYTARRATLFDIGTMNRKRNELVEKGDTGNIDMDTIMFLLFELMKDYSPEVTSPEQLAKSIPFESFKDVTTALEILGFKVPQPPKVETQETGA